MEIVKRVKENKLKEYPLSASQLIEEVKKKVPTIKQPEIYNILKENDVKNNKEYSTYVFRNNGQEEAYEKDGTLPAAIPSIYKPAAVALVERIFKNNSKKK